LPIETRTYDRDADPQKGVSAVVISEKMTILHVEDDADLAWIVRTSFEDFGFVGAMITAKSVKEALEFLSERERTQEPLSLIISDMGLPDGSGLDLIREVKTHPYWRMTPVIVLSGERNPEVINAAYALGANSYLPKDPRGGNLVTSLESFYKCWLENIQLPRTAARDRVQDALDRAIGLRTRTSTFYLNLARGLSGESETKFWLDRALLEGNLANLLAFFRNKLTEKDIGPDLIDRLVRHQARVANSLITAENRLKNTPSPDPELLFRWVLELIDAIDEEIFAEALSRLLPKNPVVATALRARAAAQFNALGEHVMESARKAELRQRAASLLDRARMLEETGK
jgi:chemotaxis family two-component system response regulator Rcp1